MPPRLTLEEFIRRAKEAHGDKFDYSLVVYISSHVKITIICNKCGHIFEQTPHSHLKGVGCPKCAGRDKTTEEIIREFRKVHGERYDYSEADFHGVTKKVKIGCPEHGIFLQTPVIHLQGSGCAGCSGNIKHTTEEFIRRARKVHGDKYDYSEVNYQGNKIKVKIICRKCGHAFWQKPNTHLWGSGCPKCALATQRSKGEIEMCDFIKLIYSGKILENDKRAIKPKELDIYLPELNLAFEYNGEHWHELHEEREPGYHKNKRQACKNKNIRLVEIWEKDWYKNKTEIKNKIKEIILKHRQSL